MREKPGEVALIENLSNWAKLVRSSMQDVMEMLQSNNSICVDNYQLFLNVLEKIKSYIDETITDVTQLKKQRELEDLIKNDKDWLIKILDDLMKSSSGTLHWTVTKKQEKALILLAEEGIIVIIHCFNSSFKIVLSVIKHEKTWNRTTKSFSDTLTGNNPDKSQDESTIVKAMETLDLTGNSEKLELSDQELYDFLKLFGQGDILEKWPTHENSYILYNENNKEVCIIPKLHFNKIFDKNKYINVFQGNKVRITLEWLEQRLGLYKELSEKIMFERNKAE